MTTSADMFSIRYGGTLSRLLKVTSREPAADTGAVHMKHVLIILNLVGYTPESEWNACGRRADAVMLQRHHNI